MKNQDFELKNVLSLISGIIVTILALLTPNYFLNSFRPQLATALISESATTTGLVLFFATLIIVAVSAFVVSFINKNQDKVALKLAGIIIMVVISTIPALAIFSKDSSFGTMGIIYFIAIITAVLAWAGVVLTKSSLMKFKNK